MLVQSVGSAPVFVIAYAVMPTLSVAVNSNISKDFLEMSIDGFSGSSHLAKSSILSRILSWSKANLDPSALNHPVSVTLCGTFETSGSCARDP